jgi:beta-glucosidase
VGPREVARPASSTPNARARDRGRGSPEGRPRDRLPITFPADLDQTPRAELPGIDTPFGTPTTIEYNEGAEVGYRWFAKTGAQPLYAFGHGLSYTTFAYADLEVEGGDTITASFTITNTGDHAGADVPQLYLTEAAGDKRIRLLGFERVELQPGASEEVTLTADRRLLKARTKSRSAKRPTHST